MTRPLRRRRVTKATAKMLLRLLEERRAVEIIGYDVRGTCDFSSFMLFATGSSTTHLRALAEHVEQRLKTKGLTTRSKEGSPESGWILFDAGDLIVHLFSQEKRRYYGLERLWGDAERL